VNRLAGEPLSTPPTRYASSDGASIAYQVVGGGPIDLVLVLGFATHLELQWELPPLARFLGRLAQFSRLIVFDKRGTGLSDPVVDVPTLEQRIDDIRAVMDAAASERAAKTSRSSTSSPITTTTCTLTPEQATPSPGKAAAHDAAHRDLPAPD
jgi:hypothetical protein